MYFAQEQDIGTRCMKKVTDYVDFIKKNGIDYQWEDVWLQYHAQQDGFMQRGIKIKGRESELAKIIINHIRNIVQHILVYSTSNRPSFLTRAINGDAQSLIQASLADSLVNYYLKEKGIEQKLHKSAEASLVLGSGYIYVNWDTKLGEVMGSIPKTDLDPNTPPEQANEVLDIHEGDIESFVPSIYDVFHDPSKKEWDELDWVIVRRFKNKYELAERYPNGKNVILNQNILSSQANNRIFRNQNSTQLMTGTEQTDDIEYFEFYHKKNILMKQGRKVVFLNDGTVLEDGEFMEKSFPVFRICPANFIDSSLGYAPTFDMQGLQEAHNATYGMILTNIMIHGLQHIQMPVGTTVKTSDVAGGSNIFETTQDGEVKGVNLLNLSGDLFNNLNYIEKQLETTSGVNAVARGNIEASQRSGSALALVQSMAIQFNSGFQNSYGRLLEDVGTQIVRLIKNHAKNKKVIEITGISERAYLQEFDPSTDLTNIDRVVVDIGNPLYKTLEGRLQVADKLLAEGHINADMYLMFIESGQLKPLLKAKKASIALVLMENDMFLQGKIDKIIVAPVDDHRLHIQEHTALLSNPEVRNNVQLSQQIWEHIQEHLVQWKQLSMTAPDLVMAIGQQPLAPTMGSNMPMASQPGEAPQAPTLNMNGAEPVMATDEARMPTNPLNGQKAPKPPQTGEG